MFSMVPSIKRGFLHGYSLFYAYEIRMAHATQL